MIDSQLICAMSSIKYSGACMVQSPAVNSQSISHLLCRVAEKAAIWLQLAG